VVSEQRKTRPYAVSIWHRNKEMKKIAILILLMAGIWAGCTKAAVKTETPPANEPQSVGQATHPEPGSEGVPVSSGTNEGITTMQGLPANWPSDVPVMEGFTVQNSMVNTQGMISIMAFGSVSPDDVTKYYSSLPGWEKDSNKPWVTQGVNRLVALKKDAESLTVNINDNKKQGRTEVTLTYHK
jgi:hypothetical protein